MKRKLAIILWLFIATVAHAVVTCGTPTNISQPNVYSAAIDSRNSSLLVFMGGYWISDFSNQPIDNMGNAWQSASTYSGSTQTQPFFVPDPIASSSHTFKMGGTYPSGIIMACSGTRSRNPLAAQNGIRATTLVFQTGSVTPGVGDLVVTSVTTDNPSSAIVASIDSGFGAVYQSTDNNNTVTLMSYKVAGSTTPLNPQWTLNAAAACDVTNCGVTIMVFKAAGSAPALTFPWITDFAGNGGYSANRSCGTCGDGGLPTDATSAWPLNPVIDSRGIVIFSNANDNAIRAVNTTKTSQVVLGVTIAAGRIGTVAGTGTLGCTGNGGTALSATFSIPAGLALDSSDNLFIADQRCHEIRRVDAITGIVTKVVGSGANPGCNGGDGSSSGDGGPSGSIGLFCPQGVAVDAAGNIIVFDTNNDRIIVANTQGTTQVLFGVSICAGCAKVIYGGAGQLHWPLNGSRDSSGNLFVADYLHHQVVKITPAGVATVIAGTGVAGHSGMGGLATLAKLNSPAWAGVNPVTGDIYICDSLNNLVLVIDHVTGIITVAVGDYDVVGNNTPGVDRAGGYFAHGGPAVRAGVRQPSGIAFLSNGDFYIGELFNNRVSLVQSKPPLTVIGGATVQ